MWRVNTGGKGGRMHVPHKWTDRTDRTGWNDSSGTTVWNVRIDRIGQKDQSGRISRNGQGGTDRSSLLCSRQGGMCCVRPAFCLFKQNIE